MRTFFLLLSVLLMSTLAISQTQKQLLTPELLWKVGRVSLDCVSPDGKYAVYGVTRFDMEKNKGTRSLFLVDLQTNETRPLTDPAAGSASDAAFHPSGRRIGFLRDGKLFEVGLSGGAANPVTDFEINGFRYAPDGKHLLFAQQVKFDQAPTDLYADLPKASGRIPIGCFTATGNRGTSTNTAIFFMSAIRTAKRWAVP
ncbi:MAG: hypothetical protein IPM98_11525 [Lewinellaceae bacterium]|nr:hypothetical protein [Lewinellaceae bacterium]